MDDAWLKITEKKFRVSNKQKSPAPSTVRFSNKNLDQMDSVAGNLQGNP